MKKTLLLLILALGNSILLLAQERKPIAKGFLTITTGLKNEFVNLRFEGTRVFFTNVATNSRYTYLIENVLLIEDDKKNVLYDKNKPSSQNILDSLSIATAPAKKPAQKLEFVRVYSIFQNRQRLKPSVIRSILNTNPLVLEQYNKGKTMVDVGNIALAAGLGMFLGRGFSNLNEAYNTPTTVGYSNEPRQNKPPVFMITGLVIACAGVPLKIIGRKAIKGSIDLHNETPYVSSRKKDLDWVLFARNNSVGLCIKL